jgi:hypothetical protein
LAATPSSARTGRSAEVTETIAALVPSAIRELAMRVGEIARRKAAASAPATPSRRRRSHGGKMISEPMTAGNRRAEASPPPAS